MQQFPIRFLTALVLCGLAASARAAVMDFTYSASPVITAASAVAPGTTDTITNGITIGGLPGATFTSVAATGTSTITITGRNTSPTQDASLGDNTPFLDVTVISNDSATRTFSVNFDTAYVLTDPTPGGGPGPQTIHFVGKLSGQIEGAGAGFTSVSFDPVSFSPVVGTGPTVTAGDDTFKVILKSYQDPGLGASSAGGLTAFVSPVPEPATAMFMLGGLMVMCRRRRGLQI